MVNDQKVNQLFLILFSIIFLGQWKIKEGIVKAPPENSKILGDEDLDLIEESH